MPSPRSEHCEGAAVLMSMRLQCSIPNNRGGSSNSRESFHQEAAARVRLQSLPGSSEWRSEARQVSERSFHLFIVHHM